MKKKCYKSNQLKQVKLIKYRVLTQTLQNESSTVFLLYIFIYLFYFIRQLTVFSGGLNDDDGYAKRSESEIDLEYDYLVKHIHEINNEIEAEATKLQKLQEDYEKTKGHVRCVRASRMKLMVEAATTDCLKETDSHNQNNLLSRIKLLLARNKS